MARRFNTTGACDPELHYMVDITENLVKMKELIDAGAYFTINRARQYGKTTTLQALKEYLRDDFIVLSLDFQMLGNGEFQDERTFSRAFVRLLLRRIRSRRHPVLGLDKDILDDMEKTSRTEELFSLGRLFEFLSDLCDASEKPVVLMIDEVDSAVDNQVFLDFLAQLREYYLKRREQPTFQSAILAGVTDIRNMRAKIRPDEAHKVNSPWNIAADFSVNMSFSPEGIREMLLQYEGDYHTGMDAEQMAGWIYESTSGYPFLVSRLCQLIDERIAGTESFPDRTAAWTREGYLEAEKLLISEKNTLFASLTGKLMNYPELKRMISAILFEGRDYPFISTNASMELAAMYGFIRTGENTVRISNRIFETVLYNHLLSEEITNSEIYDRALVNQYYFTEGRRLNMTRILEGFVKAFAEVSQGKDEKFVEEEGRKYFMLYLKPIINGTGHSYVESRTRNLKHTDIIVDYQGEQFIIELKIWRGPAYHEEGEDQIAEYLDYYHLKKGYLLTFHFNKHKETGVKEVRYKNRVLVEAAV